MSREISDGLALALAFNAIDKPPHIPRQCGAPEIPINTTEIKSGNSSVTAVETDS